MNSQIGVKGQIFSDGRDLTGLLRARVTAITRSFVVAAGFARRFG